MTMMIGAFTTTVFVVCVVLVVLCVFLFSRCVSLECEAEDLKKEVAAKDEEVAAKDEEIDELKRCTRKLTKTNRLCINMYKAMRAELRAKAPYPTEDISRKLIDRSLRPLVWCKAGDDEWWTMVNAWRIHICKYSSGGGWCVYSVSERLKSNLDMVLPTLKEAKAEGRAWIVEQMYSIFNRDNQD